MRILSALLLSLGLAAAPGIAAASPPDLATTPSSATTDIQRIALDADDIYISRDNLMVIGLGAVGGYLIFGSALGAPKALAVIVGGVAGHWWYGRYEKERDLTPLQFRVPTRFAVEHAAASPVVQSRWLGESRN